MEEPDPTEPEPVLNPDPRPSDKPNVDRSSISTVGGSSLSVITDKNLSKAASKTVHRAIDRVVSELIHERTNEAGDQAESGDIIDVALMEVDSSSTQVLVSVIPIPEESLAHIAASPSFVHKHTIPIESTLNDGLHIHRNLAGTDIDHPSQLGIAPETTRTQGAHVPSPVGGAKGPFPPNAGGMAGAFLTGESGDTLVDEIAVAVAAASADGSTLAILHDLYNKFSELAKAFTGPTCDGNGDQRSARGNHTETRRQQVGPSSNRGTGPSNLPSDVKERVLRTLSDVKAQLNKVKDQLAKQRDGS